MYHHLQNFIIQIDKPFYITSEFWTAMAVGVALVTPWVVNWLNNKPKKSSLNAVGVSTVDQTNNTYEEREQDTLHVGRLILRNDGKFIAKSVEAYLEKIVSQGKQRDNFFPIPLAWTHGQLNKTGLTVRDIYPNQTVYLDIFNYYFDPGFAGDRQVKFAVGAGINFDNLSVMNVGKSDIYIKFYQESGQVEIIHLETNWNTGIPKMTIIYEQ